MSVYRHNPLFRTRNPLGRFVRARLHRRLFLWFGATILITAALLMVAINLVDFSANSGWRREVRRAQSFIGHQFARVWDSPAERESLAQDMANSLELNLQITDAKGHVINSFGSACKPRGSMQAPIVRDDGLRLGTVTLCADRVPFGRPIRVLFPLLLGAFVLWAATGFISRRLSRPLSELARVAREIGAGNLKSRVRLNCRDHGEVGIVAEAVNDMATRIERQMADQRELLAAVSHELRTPLARIRLLTELARDAGPTKSTFDGLDREVIEIDTLVGDLLASSRLDFSALTMKRLNAAEVAVSALERAGLDPSILDIDVGRSDADTDPASDPHGKPVWFEADATLLARVLANLLENAKAHAGSVEHLRVRTTDSTVAFEVEDRGPGFEPGDEEKVFQPFYRRPSESREAHSFGLGLALVKRIADAHGGRVYAQNRDGGGAKVGIEIPIHPSPRQTIGNGEQAMV